MISFKSTCHLLAISCLASISSLNAQQNESQNIPQEIPVIEDESTYLSGTVSFVNGDSFTGEIINWDLQSISLSSPDFIEPVTFSGEKILNILLDDSKETDVKKDTEDQTTLYFNHRYNQKGLYGVIKGGFSDIDNEHVTLKTSYAGNIKVLKKFVTKMEVDSKKGYLYTGPNSLDEWHNNESHPTWQYHNKSLISGQTAGNIAQDIQTPDSAVISFDLSWKKDESIQLYFYSSDPTQERPDNYYKLMINANNRISMSKYVNGAQRSDLISKKNQDRNNRHRFQNRDLAPVKKELNAKYEIFISKTQGIFHIFRNSKLVDTINDTAPKPGSFGSAFHLISNNNTPVRVKNLTLSKWSGHMPSKIDKEAFANLKGDGERILLKNGDLLLGKIGTVRDGIMKIETLYTPLNLPIVRMRSIDLTSSDDKEQPLMYENDIKCWFKDDGWIILKPLSIDGKILTAHHQALGKNQFDLNIFKRIDLNIYDENTKHPSASDNW